MVQHTTLTKQEQRISRLVALGYIEKEIADMMCLSAHTIHTHTKNIRKKTGARNMVDIARNFILSLDNPQHLFKAVLFIAIQLHMVLQVQNFDTRGPKRIKTNVKISRTFKIKN